MILDDILAHAKEEYPKESCGVIIIFKGRERYYPCKNIFPEPEQAFQIDPLDYAKAEDTGEIIKIVHSHPTMNPAPSGADLVSIETSGLPWIIINPLTGEHTETKPSGYKAPLIGRKFCHGVLDCYSLVQDYYSQELNIELPNVERQYQWWKKGDNLYLDGYEKHGFSLVPLKDIKVHDALIFYNSSDVPNHAGVYIGENKILHHLEERLSSRDSFNTYWRKVLWGVLRYKEFL